MNFGKYNVSLNPIEELTSLGGIVIYILITLYFLLLKEFVVFKNLIFGFVFMYFVLIIVRGLYFKKRPNKQKYNNFIEKIDASSFPSLHAARALFIALIFKDFFNNIYVTIFSLLIVLGVAYSRLYLKRHYLSDIIGGFVLAIITYFLLAFI